MNAKIVLVCLAAVVSTNAYSSGAPEAACFDMIPQHHVDPQSSSAPYQVDVSERKLRSGDKLKVTIIGLKPSDKIKGFMIQARVGDTPMGKWLVDGKDAYGQTLNCGNGIANAITHKKIQGDGPNSLTFTWEAPPALVANVNFRATIALNGGVFWGIEDYMGDMDMKIAGTDKGFTAIQADIKIPGLPLKIVMEALLKSIDAKSKILAIMNQSIAQPRKDHKESWPVTDNLTVESHQRSRIIGPGGCNIKKLYLETGAQLTQNDESSFTIFAPSQMAMDEVKEHIELLLKSDKAPDLEFGGIYTAKIVEIKDIGVMLTLYPSMPPTLLHNSQLDQRKVVHPSALGMKVDDEIQVKYFGRDPVTGFMRLSRKVLQSTVSSVIKNLNDSDAKVM